MMKTFRRQELRDSIRPERVKAVMDFGFSEPQARFLLHVLIYSGVFIERQYRAFSGIKHGQKTKDFLAKPGQPWIRDCDHAWETPSRAPVSRPVQAALRGDRRAEQPQSKACLDGAVRRAPDAAGRGARGHQALVAWDRARTRSPTSMTPSRRTPELFYPKLRFGKAGRKPSATSRTSSQSASRNRTGVTCSSTW